MMCSKNKVFLDSVKAFDLTSRLQEIKGDRRINKHHEEAARQSGRWTFCRTGPGPLTMSVTKQKSTND